MDAVAEVHSAVATSLEQWAKDGKTLFATAKALGVNTDRAASMLSGAIPTGGTLHGGATTRRRARRGRAGGGRSNGGGGAVTAQQILEYLAGGEYNQSQLATHFGVTRQTIARRIQDLGGKVRMSPGPGGQKTWTAAATAAATGGGTG